MNADVQFVLSKFGVVVSQHDDVVDLRDGGGFSGANLWKVQARQELLCLRRWPQQTEPKLLAFIHEVLTHATSARGFLPVPRRIWQGTTFLLHSEHLWELSPWMPGRADYHERPRREKLAAALAALATFHVDAAGKMSQQRQVSPGMAARLHQLEDWLAGGTQALHHALAGGSPELRLRGQKTLALFEQHAPAVRQQLQSAASLTVRLQPCIRDIWHDHVLFTGDQVTGIVDFGAMRQESVAGDIARLLGSLVRDDPEAWQAGLMAYQAIRPLEREETTLVDAFDRSGVLLANMNWLNWILLEKRQFADMGRVLARMDETLLRLERFGSLNPLDSGRVQGIARWASLP